jgi:hypothetical protein
LDLIGVFWMMMNNMNEITTNARASSIVDITASSPTTIHVADEVDGGGIGPTVPLLSRNIALAKESSTSTATTATTATTRIGEGSGGSGNLCASCDCCRLRKAKCDGKRPCGNCASKYMKKHHLAR